MWLSVCLLVLILVGGCDLSTHRSAAAITYTGICDGSAAVRVGRNQILVAYDELNSLYLFNADGGGIEHTFALGDLLDLTNDDEMDVEAAVVHEEGIWWIGSHGLTSDSSAAPNRRVLFKTSIPESGSSANLTLLAGPYDLSELLGGVVGESATGLAPKAGGINIEGLSVTGSGDLLIALRSPLSAGDSGMAAVLQITARQNAFEIVKHYQLPLGDRGVRDIVISDDGYLLIAGDVASGGVFHVYRWRPSITTTGSRTNNPEDNIEEVFAVPEGFNAEALVDMGAYWLVLSDDGKVKRRDAEAKDQDRICDKIARKSRSQQSHSSVYFRGLRFTDR